MYCEWLIRIGLFDSIVVSFLLVGHTHNDVDQKFVAITFQLRKSSIKNIYDLLREYKTAYAKCEQPPKETPTDNPNPSLFILLYSSFTIYSSFSIHPSQFILLNSSFTVHPSLFILLYTSFSIHPALLILLYSSFTIHPSVFMCRQLQCAIDSR
jgi:hypothetical protein